MERGQSWESSFHSRTLLQAAFIGRIFVDICQILDHICHCVMEYHKLIGWLLVAEYLSVDLKAFERRLTDVVSQVQPVAVRWRGILNCLFYFCSTLCYGLCLLLLFSLYTLYNLCTVHLVVIFTIIAYRKYAIQWIAEKLFLCFLYC